MVVADAARGAAGGLEDAGGHRERGEHRVEERDVDVLAATGLVALAQSEEDAAEGVEAGEVIGHRNAGAHRWTVGLTGDVHESGLGLRHRVVSREVALRAVLSVPADRAVHQARIQAAGLLDAEAELVEAARPEVLDEHVGAFEKALQYVSPFGALQVDGEAALVAIDADEIGAPAIADERSPGARV